MKNLNKKKFSNDKAMKGEHSMNNFKIGLVCEVVWGAFCAIHKHVFRKS